MDLEDSVDTLARKRGQEPGTVTPSAGEPADATRVRLFVYDARNLEELEIEDPTGLESVDAVRRYRLQVEAGANAEDPPKRILWADIEGVKQVDALEAIGRAFDLHPLVLEDIATTEQRAKLEDYGGYIYIVARMLVNRIEHSTTTRSWVAVNRHLEQSIVASEQVSLIVAPGLVISVQEADEPDDPQDDLEREHGDVFEGVRKRLRQGNGELRRSGADYLAYALLDAIVDNYFVIVERLGERVELVEDGVILRPTPRVIREIHVLRRDMLVVRRAVWPLREVLGACARGEDGLFADATRIYLRDVVDHSIEVIDTVETLRDIVTGLLETYLSSVSNRLNQVMKVLTIISTIFMPLTFIVGVYGMNFERLFPSTDNPDGFWMVMGACAVIVAAMLALFRRRGWI
jgi:magnesium transporter